jgi:hypothetical protein
MRSIHWSLILSRPDFRSLYHRFFGPNCFGCNKKIISVYNLFLALSAYLSRFVSTSISLIKTICTQTRSFPPLRIYLDISRRHCNPRPARLTPPPNPLPDSLRRAPRLTHAAATHLTRCCRRALLHYHRPSDPLPPPPPLPNPRTTPPQQPATATLRSAFAPLSLSLSPPPASPLRDTGAWGRGGTWRSCECSPG